MKHYPNYKKDLIELLKDKKEAELYLKEHIRYFLGILQDVAWAQQEDFPALLEKVKDILKE